MTKSGESGIPHSLSLLPNHFPEQRNTPCNSSNCHPVVTDFHSDNEPGRNAMNNLLRGGIAGAAAYKFGGGIISTILIFILVFWLLGKC